MTVRLVTRRAGLGALAGAALVAAALTVPAPAGAAPLSAHGSARTCPAAPRGSAACFARVVLDATGKPMNGKPSPNVAPAGYGPADLQSAYALASASASGGVGKTVAIVDAYNDPTAEQDLGTYRTQYGLPACTTANGCFSKVNQTGGTSYPRTDAGWATEISLDLDMVSAVCPNCHILLVEANSSSFTNLGAAVSYAAKHGAVAISNSYGGSDSSAASSYNQPGIAVTASTGDNGYGVESPASFPYVVAVGGTHLTRSSSTRGWSESAWSGAGSGCSTINPNPGWQSGTSCGKKANADVSAVADPNTGVAVYDSTSYQGRSGWQVYGGTSVASPIIASVYALADDFGTYAGQHTWSSSASNLNDVTSGSNGSCTTSVWCTAGPGWDGPTGLGTPNGTGAF